MNFDWQMIFTLGTLPDHYKITNRAFLSYQALGLNSTKLLQKETRSKNNNTTFGKERIQEKYINNSSICNFPTAINISTCQTVFRMQRHFALLVTYIQTYRHTHSICPLATKECRKCGVCTFCCQCVYLFSASGIVVGVNTTIIKKDETRTTTTQQCGHSRRQVLNNKHQRA